MSEAADKVKKLVSLKTKLQKRIDELKSELEELQSILEAVNSILLEKGFRRPEIAEHPTEMETPSEKETIPEVEPSLLQPAAGNPLSLTTADGEPLAAIYMSDDSVRIVPASDKDFKVNMPPFMSFLVERVFMKMQERDNELARTGQIAPDQIFSYNITREGDTIKEITVRNVDPERLRELRSSIRWTLEKMYEKIRSQG